MEYMLYGWRGSAILAMIYMGCEAGALLISGDIGGIIYVGFHFGVAPILCILHVMYTMYCVLIKSGSEYSILHRIAHSISITVPVIILLTTYFWPEGMLEILETVGLSFNPS
ncbi:MAG: hypothetical protein OEZ32_11840 [Nitrospinota bacterium]|nr:hypothetical protein [Nitrospinota bacterium]